MRNFNIAPLMRGQGGGGGGGQGGQQQGAGAWNSSSELSFMILAFTLIQVTRNVVIFAVLPRV